MLSVVFMLVFAISVVQAQPDCVCVEEIEAAEGFLMYAVEIHSWLTQMVEYSTAAPNTFVFKDLVSICNVSSLFKASVNYSDE